MSTQNDKARLFHCLHVPGQPLVLFNAWDAGSARAVAEAGAQAIATGSWSVAAANGFADGEHLPFAFALDNLRRIVAAVAQPVTIDLESGYGDAPALVSATVAAALKGGAVGCNLEDSFPTDGRLRDMRDQTARLAAARQAAEDAGVGMFINARTDVFFQKPADVHDMAMVDAALERAHAYADAGASGLFVPGVVNEPLIARLAEASPLPLNIMVMPGVPGRARLAELGVARISHGPGPYRGAMQWLAEAARAAMA
ncbi:isocitrate lyase/PEP mutase family protein [Frateuria terrea]|uniref:2-Methylisocitrate lyase, PEP mutase family n=1 Tax=Frateuria terrea TaxID=529704 RepID=A0A1H6YFT4_9GAMM|nr:isocitrate lyase/phosphoenolpyruvate mutase family protein [Frateuria terrea]SEJ40109.1 2-Methylisocitrate lyase, PEP mutase family [Frateuria terrea]SFP75283.1 2-Methylisocitrate lyase, PEP mutase family [Frateuria terrea]